MADVKSLLKEARKHIEDKNFKEAQECCKNVLRKDKQNYLALVLLGKSLQDSDQAPLAYQKAISSKPDNPLAWQGLAIYYENKEDHTSKVKLLSIYAEILKLQLEEEKCLEIINKIGTLGITLKSEDAVSALLNFINSASDKVYEVAEKQLVDCLKKDVPCKEDEIPMAIKILDSVSDKDPNNAIKVLYGKVILQKSDFVSAANELMDLKHFTSDVVFREWFCKYLCERFVSTGSFSGFPIENHVENIIKGIENSKYPGLLQSMICFDKQSYLEAYRQCVPLVNYNQADVTEATFILNCTIKLKKWPVTQKLALNFLTKTKDEDFMLTLRKCLMQSLAKQQKWKEAASIAKQLPLELLEESELILFAECYVEIGQNIDNILEKIKTPENINHLKALLHHKQQKYSETIALLENANDPVSFFYLGRAHWELRQYDKCLVNLLKAAKLNSEHAPTFLYLGKYYYEYKNDLAKAKKCLEKAYSLNSIDNVIAKSLSEIYCKLSMKDEDFNLLTTASKDIQTDETWIHFRLGLQYLNRKEWENAIINFRNVIKKNHNDTVAYECLADAYYGRGSFTSALKAYNKVIALNPNKESHCLTRIGYIYSLLTQYDESIAAFQKVLTMEPSSILSLKGLAETWMRIAKKKVTAKLYGSARDCAQNAIDSITKALKKQREYLCLWKLLGDLLIFVTKLPNKYAYVYLQNTQTESNTEIIKREKTDIFPHAIACYSYVAKQKQHSSSYDLASSYLMFYLETRKIENCNISFNLALACIKTKPNYWRYWNLLGKICLYVKKYNLAQHCFIKALLVTRKWSVAKIWCNLGTLYLKLKLYKLANYCFWRGQSTLPSYPQSWIGQALIAENIREEEAMDLFRHASRLGYHPESALGYADWVCRTLSKNDYQENSETRYEIEGLYAITYATDLVEWFLGFDPLNACALTMLGILQERSGLLRSAYTSYEKALLHATEDKKNIAWLNMGRILMRMGKYEEAVKAYKSITEASLNSAGGLALALYKNGLYEESYSAYDTALHWLSNDDDEKADLLVAMAGIVYLFKGADDAKTMLFHSIQISQNKPTAYSLYAICALGLIHSDQSLSKLAVSELKKYEKDSNCGFDIGFLRSYLLVSEDDLEQGIKLLSDSLHDHPSNPLLWYCMAQYCLSATKPKAKSASCCAQRALCSISYSECEGNPGKMLATASIAEFLANNKAKALLLAKDGLHKYPNQSEVWAALLYSVLSHKMLMERKDWILSAAGHMRRHLEISRPLSRWVSLVEKKLSVRA